MHDYVMCCTYFVNFVVDRTNRYSTTTAMLVQDLVALILLDFACKVVR